MRNKLLAGCCVAVSTLSTSHGYAAIASEVSVKKITFTSESQVIRTYGNSVRKKLKAQFQQLDVAYPPKKMTWIGLKQEKALLVFAADAHGKLRQILSYRIIGASGTTGPKLKQGDMQVPEGFYRLIGFRPNVVAHLALSVNYPNLEDREHAKTDHRGGDLGSDILIHGSRWSTGCLAMGNEPIEELFVLAHDSGLKNISIIFAPCDLALNKPEIDVQHQPAWLPGLYARLKTALQKYPISLAETQLIDTAKQ
ncbi:MAG TPA: L,D-transpeptidase family protein [Trichormus sp.]|jgi:hypothetical protein